MFLCLLNPNLSSFFRFEASVPIYISFYHENVNFFKTFFPCEICFLALNMNITLDLHILHRYQDKIGLYQDRENYNFRNFIKKFQQKKQITDKN